MRTEDQNTVRSLEIIHLRSSKEPIENLADRIEESMWNVGHRDGVFTIYRREGVETDLAVHIRHSGADVEVPSPLGLQLVSSLAEFGLVKHSVWEEIGSPSEMVYDQAKETGTGGLS